MRFPEKASRSIALRSYHSIGRVNCETDVSGREQPRGITYLLGVSTSVGADFLLDVRSTLREQFSSDSFHKLAHRTQRKSISEQPEGLERLGFVRTISQVRRIFVAGRKFSRIRNIW